MEIEDYTPVSVKDRVKKFESSKYGHVKDSKDAVPSTTNGLENESVEMKVNGGTLSQHSSETEEEKFIPVKQRAQVWENNKKTTTDKKDESNKNVVKNLSSSMSEISTDENVSDDSGLESELEITLSTSSHFETNHDEANDVKKNVDNQTPENVLQPQEALLEKAQKELAELTNCVTGHETRLEALEKQSQEESESLKQKTQNLESENATLNSELDKTKSQHSKTNEVSLGKAQRELAELTNCVTGNETRLEALEKQSQEESESLKQKIQVLESKNATLKDELEKIKGQHSNDLAKHKTKLEELEKQNQEGNQLLKQKTQNLESENATLNGELEKTQKELEESKSSVARYETRLEVLDKLNEENQPLKQKTQNLENENATLKGELDKTKTKTNEVPLEKAELRFFKVASVNLAAMLVVLSIASSLSVLPIIAISVISALIVSGVTYAISKPTTQLKEVDIDQVQHGVYKT